MAGRRGRGSRCGPRPNRALRGGREGKEQFTDLLLVVEVGRLELHVAHLLPTTSKPRLDPAPVGRLDEAKRAELDRALRYALDVRY
jgi:hypothetical protein